MDPLTLFFFIFGFVILILGADWLVRGGSWLAAAWGISPLVIGLTIVAFGTSTPELAVSLIAEFTGSGDLGLGNVVGSNIANILLILGSAAAAAPLIVAQQLVRIEVPLMIGVSVLTLILAQDGDISRFDGVTLFVGIVAYTGFSIYQSRRESQSIQDEYAEEFDIDADRRPITWAKNVGFVLIGLVSLTLGGQWMVNGAVAVARLFGVDEIVIGLTIVAVGTSLPELATSVVASVRGERDIAVGNAIGSNLFNLMFVLGALGIFSTDGVPVSAITLRFDLPVMIAVAVATLPIFAAGYRLDRWEGFMFLGYYVAYLITQVLAASNATALNVYSNIMLFFVIPLTVITLLTIYYREFQRRQTPPASTS